jgi:hypothetical protein
MASAAPQTLPPSPFDRLVSADALRAAWAHVRRSAAVSASPLIRAEARRFADDADAHLARLAAELAADRFLFAPALGVARPRPGKGPRPIVVAPIESRVVTRALLDVLLGIPAVSALCLGAPHSYGGLPGRGVPAAVGAALGAIRAGAAFHVRSDIAAFFRAIPRDRAVAAVAAAAGDARLGRLVDRATATEIANAAELGPDAELFPGEHRGVAQGNALSTLLGNVALRGFDDALSGRGITCLRYVDDFVLLGPRAAPVRKAFAGAGALLGALGMRAYDPLTEPAKAAAGPTAAGVTWLGCELDAAGARPSAANQRALLERVDRILVDAARGGRVAAALGAVAEGARAFQAAYAFCECPAVFAALQARIERRVGRAFRRVRVGPGLARAGR